MPRRNRSITRTAQQIGVDEFGNILPLTAGAIMLILMLIGGGVDASRTYQAQNRLQYACDAGTLAGRRAVATNGFDTAARTKATQYFNSNFDKTIEDTGDTTFTATSDDDGHTVTGVATTRLNMVVMNTIGFDEITLTANCSASMAIGNSDVVMVLDTTGSMSSNLAGTTTTRIQALRAAMINFYSTVQTSAAGSNARIRFGFVPYSSAVNVGRLLPAEYLADQMTIQSREPVYVNVNVQEFDHWGTPVASTSTGYSVITYGAWADINSTSYNSQSSCQNGMSANTAYTNSGTSTSDTTKVVNANGQQVETTTVSQKQTATEYRCNKTSGKWYRQSRVASRFLYTYNVKTSDPVTKTVVVQNFDHWLYKPVQYDTSAFKTFATVSLPRGTNAANANYTWNGCIEERETVSEPSFSYSTLLGMQPSGAFDLDIDSAPEIGNPRTQWRPMWPELAYYRTQWVTNRSGGTWGLSSNPTSLDGAKSASYCPYRAQLLAELDQGQFTAYANSLKAEGSTYHDLGMVWGARLISPEGIFSSNVLEEPENGSSVARHVIFMTDGEMAPDNDIYSTYGVEWHDRRITDDGSSQHSARHTSRFLALCEATKAKGVRLWVIAFATSMSGDLARCASDGSSFTASNATQLNAAFQEIAKDVGELRITQ